MKDKLAYVIIAILGLALGITGSLYVTTKMEEQKKEEEQEKLENKLPVEEKVEDKITFVSSTNEDGIIKDEYEIILNQKKRNITIDYTLEEFPEENHYRISGVLSGIQLFSYGMGDQIPKETSFTSEFINERLNTKNFEIVKGTDGLSYLAIRTYDYLDQTVGLQAEEYQIFNDNFDNINNGHELSYVKFSEGLGVTGNIWYEDKFNICENPINCQIRTKIEDNKIYVLYYISNPESIENSGSLEERVYTISNNQLNYEVLNTYPAVPLAGGSM